MSVKSLVLAATASGMLVTGANAAEYTVQSDIADYEPYFNIDTTAEALSNGTGGDVRVGSRTSTTRSSAVFGFALPTLTTGETISGATLTVTVEGEDNRSPLAGANLDLYGLPFDPGSFDQIASRQYQGPNDTTVGVTKLQDNYITSEEAPGGDLLTTYTEASMDISAYLNSLYADGATGGDFAVLRLSQDVVAPSGNIDRFRIVSSGGDGSTVDSAPHTIEEGAPFLSITTTVIPEPTSLAAVGLGGLGLLRRRRSSR